MKKQKNISFINKKAKHNYELLDYYTAGIRLESTEIKSVRAGKISFGDSYCKFKDKELFLINFNISEYEHAFIGTNHEPMRDRILFLTKQELKKLKKKIEEKGLTLVPTKVFIDEHGWAKVEIALGRGKDKRDKREDIKRKDIQRDMERNIKYG